MPVRAQGGLRSSESEVVVGDGVADAPVRTLKHPLDGADVARMIEVGGMEVEAQQVAGAREARPPVE